MALHAQTNIMAFNEKLNEFRASGRYCDVSIQVEDRSFRCHRLALTTASEYFDTMFNGHFLESKITLREVDASTFAEVLCFVYTGDVVVSRENAFSLLRASEFLKLDGVDELCTRFIDENLPIPEMFGVLSFARLTKRTRLVGLLSRYVMKHFDELADDPQFLELSYDNVLVLLSQRWYLSPKNKVALVTALVQWVNYVRDSRLKYFEALFEKVEIRNMSEELVKSVLKQVILFEKFADAEPARSPTEDEGLPIEATLGLHVYTACWCDQKTRIYSTSKSFPSWRMSYKINYPNGINRMACIGLDDYLYCLDSQTFRAYHSLDISPDCSGSHTLIYPPFPFYSLATNGYCQMCTVGNNIYVHGPCDGHLASKSSLSSQKLSQGIFGYDVVVGSWFPVPVLKKRFPFSTITADNNVLYYVAGRDAHDSDTIPEGNVSIQSLDFRTSTWQDVTNNSSQLSEDGVVQLHLCSVAEGKMYLCPQNPHCLKCTFGVKSYDLTAKKWIKVEPWSEKYVSIYQLLQYENLLWTFGFSESSLSQFMVKTYNPTIGEWSSPVNGALGTVKSTNNELQEDFVQAVVFKN